MKLKDSTLNFNKNGESVLFLALKQDQENIKQMQQIKEEEEEEEKKYDEEPLTINKKNTLNQV